MADCRERSCFCRDQPSTYHHVFEIIRYRKSRRKYLWSRLCALLGSFEPLPPVLRAVQSIRSYERGINMSDASLLLLVESQKKSGAIAALLNLVFPGAGYMYCGNWILGIVAFAIFCALFVATLGIGPLLFWPVVVVDGLLCAKRYNKKLIERVLIDQVNESKI